MTSSPDALPPATTRTPGGPDTALDDALLDTVRRAGRTGADLEVLWHAAIAVDSELAVSVDRRRRLADVVDRLVTAGHVRRPPSTPGAQDRSAEPWLPRVLRAATAPAPQRAPAPELPPDLVPELAPAKALARPRADEIATLRAANDFLRDFDPSRTPSPLRERSLEVFGDEKRLDALGSQRLFAEGVLSLELLHCYPVHPPFIYERISSAPAALVVENHHTYDSARRALAEDDRGFGVVGYGAGRAFCAAVASVVDLDPRVEILFYFGDLDVAGLQIPVAASKASAVPVVPARGLYEALLQADRRRPGSPVATQIVDELVGWLPEALRPGAKQVLLSGAWLPQEAVGLERLRAMARWQ